MSRRLKQASVVVVLILAAAQFVRPDLTNPATDASHAIYANAGAVVGLAAVLGRAAVNFSEWSEYSAATQDSLLEASCKAVTGGRMPGRAWTTLHPRARLTQQDVATICAAAQEPAT